jgi:hypothetical protein
MPQLESAGVENKNLIVRRIVMIAAKLPKKEALGGRGGRRSGEQW